MVEYSRLLLSCDILSFYRKEKFHSCFFITTKVINLELKVLRVVCRVLGKLGLESTPINTKGYETLLGLVRHPVTFFNWPY